MLADNFFWGGDWFLGFLKHELATGQPEDLQSFAFTGLFLRLQLSL